MPLLWPARSSILMIVSRGSACCARLGAAFRLPTCTRSSAPTRPSFSLAPSPSFSPSARISLSAEGREAVNRLTGAIEFAERLRSEQPTAALGTGLEQVWLRLGGAQCVDTEARANLDLLWKSLDALPQGEPDLLGPALNAALENLTALPDPAVESDFGVQLMTIHKAKGLEFEVVIVPDLQKRVGRGKHEMLSWLERGLPPEIAANEGENSGEVTEFLIAPFSPKGSDRSEAKKWVDDLRRAREKQEERRLLYVAATRAREELHFFARLSCENCERWLSRARRASRQLAAGSMACVGIGDPPQIR